MNVRDILPASFAGTKIVANWLGWFEGATGTTHRPGVCRSDDPRTVKTQVELAKQFGLNGFTVDWYGRGNDRVNQATLMLMQECERQEFEFSIMFDSGIVKWLPPGTDKNVALLAEIEYAVKTYVPSSAYSRIASKPVAFEFGWDASVINIAQVVSKYPQFVWVSQNTLKPGFNGTFGWVTGFPPDTPYAYIERMLQQSDLLVPAVLWGFDDTSWRPGETGSIWNPKSPARIIDPNFGLVWAYSWDRIKAKYATKPPAMIQICTWNDYDERTCIEPFVLAMTGGRLY